MTTSIARATLTSILLGLASASATEVEQTLESWLDANNARVIAFLRAIPDGAVGSTVRGVELTDGTRVLVGSKYLGQVRDAGPGAHVYLFSDGGTRVAYIWVDPSGAPLALPDCETGPSDDEPQRVLSGDVYTFRELQPGDGIVVFRCANDRPWNALAPDRTVQPTRPAEPDGTLKPAAAAPAQRSAVAKPSANE
jgi:hypothetical protein